VMAAMLVALPMLPPAPVGLGLVVVLLVFTAAAATQDVAIDAYTIELLEPGEEGVANGLRVSAYRAALIVGGGVLVGLAVYATWSLAYAAAAVILAALALFVLRLPPVRRRPQTPREWAHTFRAWVERPGAWAVFAFVFLYFLMHVCDKEQAATQYALLSALFNLSGSLAGAFSGIGVQYLGYGAYFALTFAMALPAYALMPRLRGWIRTGPRPHG